MRISDWSSDVCSSDLAAAWAWCRSGGACVRRDRRRRSVPSWRGQRRIAGWGSGWGGHPVSDGTKHSGHRVNCPPPFSMESTMSEQDPRLLPVLLSGGSGTRLWPLSREAYPKQFLPLAGEGTMLHVRKSVLYGKCVSVRFDLGVRPFIK